ARAIARGTVRAASRTSPLTCSADSIPKKANISSSPDSPRRERREWSQREILRPNVRQAERHERDERDEFRDGRDAAHVRPQRGTADVDGGKTTICRDE